MDMLFKNEIIDQEQIKEFKRAYADFSEKGIMNYFVMVKGDYETPGGTSMILVRIFIENGERAKSSQKYVAMLRFSNFGDMAILDIISLNKPNHRDIAREHAKRMGLRLFNHQDSDEFRETYALPCVIAGAYVQVRPHDELSFFDESKDFGSRLLGIDVNNITEYAVRACGINADKSSSEDEFFGTLLNFLLTHGRRADFYGDFVRKYMVHGLTGQNLGGLLSMKVYDRLMLEPNSDIFKLYTEELSGGLARVFLLEGANLSDILDELSEA